MWFGTLTQNRNFLSGLQRSFKPDEEVSRWHTLNVSLTHTQAHAHAHPPHACKKQFPLVNLQVLAKKKKAFKNRTLTFAQNTCTLTPKSSHIAEYIFALEGRYGFSWHLDQQHFSSLLKPKHLPRSPLCVVSVIWVSFACLQVRTIQPKISFHFLDWIAAYHARPARPQLLLYLGISQYLFTHYSTAGDSLWHFSLHMSDTCFGNCGCPSLFVYTKSMWACWSVAGTTYFWISFSLNDISLPFLRFNFHPILCNLIVNVISLPEIRSVWVNKHKRARLCCCKAPCCHLVELLFLSSRSCLSSVLWT